MKALFTGCNFENADLSGCNVYGTSVWDVSIENAIQDNLVITPPGTPAITVDDIEVAQFLYLIMENKKIRSVIDSLTTKVVLILGRFTPSRKNILDAIHKSLRAKGYVPVLFDFEKPNSATFIETVLTIAHMSKFIVADVSRAKIILQELPAVAQSVDVPVQPLLTQSGNEPVMLYDLRVKYRWILPTFRYKNQSDLLAKFDAEVIAPAENLRAQVMKVKEV
jgi:hypothetical protein